MKNILQVITLLAFIFFIASCAKDQLTETPQALDAEGTNAFLDDAGLLKALALENEIGTRAKSSTLYTLSNEAAGNQVIAFDIHPDGKISEKGRYSTGGTGTDGGLGNQGALALGLGGHLLYAVNPGSNDFSVFYVQTDGGLILKDRVASGGIRPISITERKSIIYVLNAGGDGNISGFGYNNQAQLVPIPNSTKPLSSNASGPAQISFSSNGKALVVTEKATNTITSYRVLLNKPWNMNTFPAAGATPFGFAFGNNNNFYVSEAAGGAPGASTISSYHVDNNGNVALVDGPLPTNRTAACWVVLTNNSRFLFTTNTGSNDISTIGVSGFGGLDLLADIAAPASSTPIDAALDNDSNYLYVLATGGNTIISYSVSNQGALNQIDVDGGGLPNNMTGLVVR
ncbi:MAG: 3-carboxymuconate cyclase [Lewinellaceae bacterium]|nr:hypothetical protein [Saprospiraceae bacterium]MCB9338293.1 3-carboxymuconate cyclase [Lewinellaceae bacterium]